MRCVRMAAGPDSRITRVAKTADTAGSKCVMISHKKQMKGKAMSSGLRLTLAALASLMLASQCLASEVSVYAFATRSDAQGSEVVYEGGRTEVPPFGPTSVLEDSGYPPPCGAAALRHHLPGPDDRLCRSRDWKARVLASGFHNDSAIYAVVSRASFTAIRLVFFLPPGMASAPATISMSIDADLPPQNINGRVTGGATLFFGEGGSEVNFQDAATRFPSHFHQTISVTETVEDRIPTSTWSQISLPSSS